MKKRAQSLIEYGLILALVAIIALAVLSKFGTTITKVGDSTDKKVDAVTENSGKSFCDAAGGDWDPDTDFCKLP